MTPHPDSPRAHADRLGLALDLTTPGSPAIVGPTGKRHYYNHGGGLSPRPEAVDVLKRLARLRAAKAAAQ